MCFRGLVQPTEIPCRLVAHSWGLKHLFKGSRDVSMRIFRMMNCVSDWCPYIFGMSSFWYFDVFFWCWGLDDIIWNQYAWELVLFQNWMDHSHHSGKVRNWREHWQVYVTDVEFTRDGTILVYIEKCRDWFRTYHILSLCSSGLFLAATVVVCT